MTIFSAAHPRFGSTIVVTGPTAEAVNARIQAESKDAAASIGLFASPFGKDQFRARLLVNDEHSPDVSKFMGILALPFNPSDDVADNDQQMDAGARSLPPEASLFAAATGYAVMMEAAGKATMITIQK